MVELIDRSLLCLSGKDAKKLLQGIITNNVQQLAGQQCAMYCGFLNPKGRLISDAIIVQPKKANKYGQIVAAQDEYWLDVSDSTVTKVRSHIDRLTWKKRVELSELDKKELSVYALYNTNFFEDSTTQKCGTHVDIGAYDEEIQPENYVNFSFYDPRSIKLGVRMVGQRGSFDKGIHKVVTLEDYKKFSILNGVVDSKYLSEKIPFQYNMDLLNGLSFQKGCYLGQELISRVYHTGIVRKRVFPYELENKNETLTVDTVVKERTGKEMGKVVVSQGSTGMILLDYLGVRSDFHFIEPKVGQIYSPQSEELTGYLKIVKQKQQNLQKFNDL